MKTLHISIIIMVAFGVTPVFALDISQISVGANPWAISVNPDTNRVYVTNFGNNSVSVIDGNTNTVTKQIIVGDSPTGVVVNPDTGFVYVSRFSAPIVSVISEKTYTIAANITVGSKPNGLGIDTITDEIYVTNMGDGTVSIIDGKTNTVTDTIPVQIRPTAISVNPYTGMAYVTNSGSGTVSVIDTKTNTVSDTIQTGKGPTGVVADNYTNTVYVTDSPTSQVFVIGAKTNTISSTIKVGPNPDGISIDHTKNKIYVANSGDGTVSVIDGNTNMISETISVGTNTYSIATNPVTGITYTANDSPGMVYVISDNTASQSSNAKMQNNSSISSKCTDNMTQDMKTKYLAFDEEHAKTFALNYDKFKSEVKDDKYVFRAISQEWTDNQSTCTATMKNALVLFFVTDNSGKQRDVTVLIDPISYKPQGISVEYDVPTHGGVEKTIAPLKQFKSGIAAKDVVCKEGNFLVIKSKDGLPACVTDSSMGKMIRQGWWAWNVNVGNIMIDNQGKKNFDYKNCAVIETKSAIVGTNGFVLDDLPDNGTTFYGADTSRMVGGITQFTMHPGDTAQIIFTYDFNSYPGSNCKLTTDDVISAENPGRPGIKISDLISTPDILKVDENSVNTSIPPLGNSGDILLNLVSTENLNDHVVKAIYKISAKPDAQVGKSYFIGFWWHSSVVITVGDSLYMGSAFEGPHYG